MRARAWSEPVASEADELLTRPEPHVAARLVRTQLPREPDEKVGWVEKKWYQKFNEI